MAFTPKSLQLAGFDKTSTVVAPPGSGDTVGPASSTDNAVARFDGTTGKLLQNSSVAVSDTGTVTANALNLDASGNLAFYKSGNKLIYGDALDDAIQSSATASVQAANAYILSGTWYRYDTAKPAVMLSAEDDGKVYKYTAAAGTGAITWSAAEEIGTGGSSLPDQTGNAGKYLTTDGTTASWGTVSGGSTVSPSYFWRYAASATVTYSATNATSSSESDPNWSVVKTVLSGNNRQTKTVYTATGAVSAYSSLTYATSLTYNA